jgi:phage terminase large subunit
MCSFEAPLSGSYFGAMLAKADAEKRIGIVPYDPALKVHTAWDLGIDDMMAIWFVQTRGPEVRWIDFYQSNGEGLAHYINYLQTKPYVYGNHYAPHDIKVRELGTGKSRLEVAGSLGLKFTVAPDMSLPDGIDALRRTLATSWFDADKTGPGLDALRNYRREWDDTNKTYKSHPLHDWSSHATDAARTFAVAHKEVAPSSRKLHINSQYVV